MNKKYNITFDLTDSHPASRGKCHNPCHRNYIFGKFLCRICPYPAGSQSRVLPPIMPEKIDMPTWITPVNELAEGLFVYLRYRS